MNRRFTLTLICPHKDMCLTSKCGISEPFNPNTQKQPYPKTNEYEAIWDTGATYCAITQKVVDELGLSVKRPIQTNTANGLRDTYAYLVNVFLPNNVMIPGRWATLSTIKGADILIGMDIIGMGDFAVSRVEDNIKFTFQLPPTHSTDYQQEYDLLQKYNKIHLEWLKHGNNMCPCGSGKQYEKCHSKKQ